MIGMNAQTGRPLSGVEHLKQSIRDIVTTPLGSRVMRRDYGCGLFDLLDSPFSSSLVGDITLAISEGLEKWEPRFRLESVAVHPAGSGKLSIDINGLYLINGEPVIIEGIQV
ncbi:MULTISPECIES: GPW/gp25 family protein [Pseudoalteromonas]|uniref:Baseplate assembly protein W n=1 Tax=Pseudoalteromonas amylolytica TaxID=1859457 RepID=A0A1S1MW91_9GAMM|nr:MULTISPECIES: GPW/gp25 family protein [Pseudoalteromonas]MCF6435243.1 GPW/gp25 family protein [Pseudoalteromonas sp. MMG022]OHU87843.1 baseplate assembly protein W [Pseudoalteromonas sp. JW3]OHU91283.1 baseplate assembly protein W [Pseudoalteromonas amylolytica]